MKMSILNNKDTITLNGVIYVHAEAAQEELFKWANESRKLIAENAMLAKELAAQSIREQVKKVAPKQKPVTVAELKYGQEFKKVDYHDIYMKIKPSGVILNSTLIRDHLVRGNCFIVNTEYSTLSICKGDTPVRLPVPR